MDAWHAQSDRQRMIERIARALMSAERKSTLPEDILMFMDPFRWDGELTTFAGAHKFEDISNKRPAWTAPRIIRMANAALNAIKE